MDYYSDKPGGMWVWEKIGPNAKPDWLWIGSGPKTAKPTTTPNADAIAKNQAAKATFITPPAQQQTVPTSPFNQGVKGNTPAVPTSDPIYSSGYLTPGSGNLLSNTSSKPNTGSPIIPVNTSKTNRDTVTGTLNEYKPDPMVRYNTAPSAYNSAITTAPKYSYANNTKTTADTTSYNPTDQKAYTGNATGYTGTNTAPKYNPSMTSAGQTGYAPKDVSAYEGTHTQNNYGVAPNEYTGKVTGGMNYNPTSISQFSGSASAYKPGTAPTYTSNMNPNQGTGYNPTTINQLSGQAHTYTPGNAPTYKPTLNANQAPVYNPTQIQTSNNAAHEYTNANAPAFSRGAGQAFADQFKFDPKAVKSSDYYKLLDTQAKDAGTAAYSQAQGQDLNSGFGRSTFGQQSWGNSSNAAKVPFVQAQAGLMDKANDRSYDASKYGLDFDKSLFDSNSQNYWQGANLNENARQFKDTYGLNQTRTNADITNMNNANQAEKTRLGMTWQDMLTRENQFGATMANDNYWSGAKLAEEAGQFKDTYGLNQGKINADIANMNNSNQAEKSRLGMTLQEMLMRDNQFGANLNSDNYFKNATLNEDARQFNDTFGLNTFKTNADVTNMNNNNLADRERLNQSYQGMQLQNDQFGASLNSDNYWKKAGMTQEDNQFKDTFGLDKYKANTDATIANNKNLYDKEQQNIELKRMYQDENQFAGEMANRDYWSGRDLEQNQRQFGDTYTQNQNRLNNEVTANNNELDYNKEQLNMKLKEMFQQDNQFEDELQSRNYWNTENNRLNQAQYEDTYKLNQSKYNNDIINNNNNYNLDKSKIQMSLDEMFNRNNQWEYDYNLRNAAQKFAQDNYDN